MSENLSNALTVAFNGVKTDVLSTLEVALPAGLGIAAVILSIRIGISFFKSIARN